MAEIVTLASLYLNGKAQNVGIKYNDEEISLGPAVPGKELQWVKVNNLLIADRCVCTNISWGQLDAQGFVFGNPVKIGETAYLCRCLKVGAKKADSNEWDAALDEVGEDDEIWHWDDWYFWGQETPENWVPYCAVRGYHSARHWSHDSATNRSVDVGFRPALEPLGSEPCSPETLIGKQTRIYGPGGTILEGRLLSADDYDLILEATSPLPDTCSWTSKAQGSLVVDRTNVLWIKEA